MHFVLLPIGSAGDVHPFVGLALRLRERGHQVTIFTNPHFQVMIEALGIRFEPLGTEEEFQEVVQNPDLWNGPRGFQLIARWAMLQTAPIILERLQMLREEGEIVVLAQATALGARMAQMKYDIPLLTVHLQPSMFRSAHESARLPPLLMGNGVPQWIKLAQFWLVDRLVIDRAITSPLNTLLREEGLPAARNILSDWWHSPQGTVGLFPAWYMPPQPDWPPQATLTGFPLWDTGQDQPLTAELESFLQQGEPPIAFTPGSAMLHGEAFFQTAVAASVRLNRRALLVTRHGDQISADLPPGVLYVPYAPFKTLLPRCAALVHHGGIGSAAGALAAGVPQLIYPMAHDQPDNAHLLEKLGVARSLVPKRFREERVARLLDELTSEPSIATQCRTLADRVATQDGLGDTVDWIETRVDGF